jgi:hypothetical protein
MSPEGASRSAPTAASPRHTAASSRHRLIRSSPPRRTASSPHRASAFPVSPHHRFASHLHACVRLIPHHSSLLLTPPRCLVCRRSEGRCPSRSPLGNPDGSCVRACRVGSRLFRFVACRKSAGRCPSRSPLGNPDGSPDPSAAPLGPPQACPRVIPAYAGRGGGRDVVGGSYGCGACLRCKGCIAARANGRLAAHGRRAVAPPRFHVSPPHLLIRSSPHPLIATPPTDMLLGIYEYFSYGRCSYDRQSLYYTPSLVSPTATNRKE